MANGTKSLSQGIKELRRSLDDGGLAWVHTTESAGKYLQTILPDVCKMQIRGDWRHTSSDDKYDLKKVLTTRFKSGAGTTIATCHAHGDGTWGLLFSDAGKAHLSKMNISSKMEDALEVTVHQRIDDQGRVFHYGEMTKKPDACRRPVSENNDELHRLKQAELDTVGKKGFTQLFPRMIPPAELSEENGENFELRTASMSATKTNTRKSYVARYGNDNDSLTLDQEQLAADLAKDGLTGKEQRALFQKMKAMPSDHQRLILDRSKILKMAKEREK